MLESIFLYVTIQHSVYYLVVVNVAAVVSIIASRILLKSIIGRQFEIFLLVPMEVLPSLRMCYTPLGPYKISEH